MATKIVYEYKAHVHQEKEGNFTNSLCLNELNLLGLEGWEVCGFSSYVGDGDISVYIVLLKRQSQINIFNN